MTVKIQIHCLAFTVLVKVQSNLPDTEQAVKHAGQPTAFTFTAAFKFHLT